MRALWLENQRLSLREVPEPAPRSGETLVRVLVAGVCNTDLELTHGYYPFTGIPGHEFVGESDGQRVVGEINAVCHTCSACRSASEKTATVLIPSSLQERMTRSAISPRLATNIFLNIV